MLQTVQQVTIIIFHKNEKVKSINSFILFTVLTPDPLTTTATPEVTTSTQLNTPLTAPVTSSAMSPVPIAVGVSVALIILILIGIGVVIAIVFVVKKTRQDSWSPVKSKEIEHIK